MTLAAPPGNEPTDEAVPRRRRFVSSTRATSLMLGLLVLIAGLLTFMTFRPEAPPLTTADIQDAVATSVEKAAKGPPHSATVFETILPSFVVVRTEGTAQREDGSGIGSGVIVRGDGMILTAHHVVVGARSITVAFADGTESRAEVVDTYPNDLAVLRAARGPELIVPAVLGGGVQVGDEAFVVGSPLGLTASLSAGVISGLNRSSPPGGEGQLTGLIQFDAAVNPGSSGGPLLNRNGQVIGIVTALANPSSERSFTGIGFAVPLGSAGGLGGLSR